MQDHGPKTNFWIGNAILVVAMVMLLLMGAAWERLGLLALVIWVALVIAGLYFLMKDKDGSPNLPG
ncbi:MAG: hypothetical protein K0A95_10005 [Chromatiales bacterium]|nr:hypothetical protein [Gammaproteobacteria bacterium]MBW6477392.1 hypothetical protein [Chromatiales bacterium]